MASSSSAVAQALLRLPEGTKEMAYQAWLGFYNSQSRLPWNNEQLVSAKNLSAMSARMFIYCVQVQQANH
jgi:hypothetical protein